jgi:hypothetical protein
MTPPWLCFQEAEKELLSIVFQTVYWCGVGLNTLTFTPYPGVCGGVQWQRHCLLTQGGSDKYSIMFSGEHYQIIGFVLFISMLMFNAVWMNICFCNVWENVCGMYCEIVYMSEVLYLWVTVTVPWLFLCQLWWILLSPLALHSTH